MRMSVTNKPSSQGNNRLPRMIENIKEKPFVSSVFRKLQAKFFI
jgi:hypothetical protein